MSRGGYGKLKLNGKYVYPYPYYPVGAVVIFGNNTNPNDIYIGKWVQLKDVFILACGDKYKVGDTGGEEIHTLTVSEMPSHVHTQRVAAAGGGTLEANTDYTSWVKDARLAGQIGVTTYGEGGSQPHNNMPPYVAKYYWERVA